MSGPISDDDDKKDKKAAPETDTLQKTRAHKLTVGLGMANDISMRGYFKMNPGTSYDTKLYTDGQLSHQNNFEVYNDKVSFAGNWSIFTPHLKLERNPFYQPLPPNFPAGMDDTRMEFEKYKYASPNLIGERPYVGVFDVSAAKIDHAHPQPGTINYRITGAQAFMHDPGNFTQNLQNAVHKSEKFPERTYKDNLGEKDLLGVNVFAEQAYGKRVGSRNGIQAEAVGAIGGSAGLAMRDWRLSDTNIKYGTNNINAGLSLGVGQHLSQLPIESLPIGAENNTTHRFTGTGVGQDKDHVAWKLGARFVQSVSLTNHTMLTERDVITEGQQFSAATGLKSEPPAHSNPNEAQQKKQKFGPLAGNVDLSATVAVKRVLAEFGVTLPVNDPTNPNKEAVPGVEDKILTPRLRAKVAFRF